MNSTENMGHQKPNIHHGVALAKELDLTVSFAVNARRRYLMDEIELLDLEIAFYQDYQGELDSEYFALYCLSDVCLQRAKYMAELRSIKNVNKPSNRITDADIERARDYPVNQLIEFTRGKAIAFCHEDRNPSMFYGSRTNTAQCPVCGKSFDAIAVLMDRDGYSFVDAVKSLIAR